MPKSFAESIWLLYPNENVEINTNESRIVHKYHDIDETVKQVITGRVVRALGDALVLECISDGKVSEICINCWSITSVTKIDNKLSTKDFYRDDFIAKKRNRKK